MQSDIEIAQQATLEPILDLASRWGIPADSIDGYGRYKAKVALDYLDTLRGRPDGKLILVTALSPTPAGEGKTTTSIGLGDALNRLGRKTFICLREPSLGPVFGLKGGATGGGKAQVVPMEDINLHFTGDFSAVALAHNLLAAIIDNHIHQGNRLAFDVRRITWKRVVDMNDRALRDITVGLGGPENGFPRQDGFDIVVASEVMAILCLATSLADLKRRLGNIVVGYTRELVPIHARDLKVHGAMTVLLKEAVKPNLVQTLEHNPVFIHGGPFANIAHGCNSVIATRAALKLADYVVTEAGFGADLGAEKFIDIKCRKSGLRPAAVVMVATLRALKYHGECDIAHVNEENLPALRKGCANLERHLDNIRNRFGLPCVLALNSFSSDTTAEQALLEQRMTELGAPLAVARHWAEGGSGALPVARAVLQTIENGSASLCFIYADSDTLWHKIEAIAKSIYGAAGIAADARVRYQLRRWEEQGHGHLPVCIAKTQYSFSTNPDARGAPGGHTLNIREVRLAAGAEFVVAVCGEIMTMPGLPRVPAAERIDIDEHGRIIGLS